MPCPGPHFHGAVEVRMLTERESEVAALVARGLRNKVVAHHLGIGEGTVKLHLHNIYRKLGIERRAQLVLHVAHK
jgi:two-component system, NarL family, nitrate/nitrite response regulator NarL